MCFRVHACAVEPLYKGHVVLCPLERSYPLLKSDNSRYYHYHYGKWILQRLSSFQRVHLATGGGGKVKDHMQCTIIVGK